MRSTALALCYSAAEYACPAWERSTHAKKLDATLNASCRCITGCLRPTNTNSLCLLSGIAPAAIRREVASKTERFRQTTNEKHPLFGQTPAPTRLKSRKSFLTTALDCTPPEACMKMWDERLAGEAHPLELGILPKEELPSGSDSTWAEWKCLNCLRTGVGRTKTTLNQWCYTSGQTTCECGTEPQTADHILRCPLLKEPCTTADLAAYNMQAKQCVKQWIDTV